MARPYINPGPKRLAAALRLAGFEPTKTLTPSGKNPNSYGTEVRTMLGIAYGESSGNCMTINENKNSAGTVTSTDYGVWQINDYHEGDILLRSLPKYAELTTHKAMRERFGTDPRNTFYLYLRETKSDWSSYLDNARMARIVFEKQGFYGWVAFWNSVRGFSALDNPERAPWDNIDRGLADVQTELRLGYSETRIASLYLEGLTASPRKSLTR